MLEANHRLSDRKYVHINYAGNILDQRFYDTIISRYKEDNIQYWGLVSGEEKKRLFQETDVFVVPSRDESCSLVVLEAFAAGKPVIISNQVGAKYLLTDKCGWIFDIDHIDELSGILENIGSFKYDLSDYGAEARKQYEKHVNYNEYKNKLLALVEKYSNKKMCINLADVQIVVPADRSVRFLLYLRKKIVKAFSIHGLIMKMHSVWKVCGCLSGCKSGISEPTRAKMLCGLYE